MGNATAWTDKAPNPDHETADLREYAAACGHPIICPDQQLTRRTRAHFAYVPGEWHPYIDREIVPLLLQLEVLGYTEAVLLSDPQRGRTRATHVTFSRQAQEARRDGKG